MTAIICLRFFLLCFSVEAQPGPLSYSIHAYDLTIWHFNKVSQNRDTKTTSYV